MFSVCLRVSDVHGLKNITPTKPEPKFNLAQPSLKPTTAWRARHNDVIYGKTQSWSKTGVPWCIDITAGEH